MTELGRLIKLLNDYGVEFILVGGLAGWAHGSSRATNDVDIVYRRTENNLARLANALQPMHPYLRGAPPGLPFKFDAQTLNHGLNFTLSTDIGAIDLLGEIAGGGSYEMLLEHSSILRVFGNDCRCLNIDKLIEVKRAAGRPKDLEAIAELEIIRDEQQKN